jgi:hypothetical protein
MQPAARIPGRMRPDLAPLRHAVGIRECLLMGVDRR